MMASNAEATADCQGMNPRSGIVCYLILFLSLVLLPRVRADCVPAPSGLVAWWQGESNFINSVDGSAGTPLAGIPFTPGEVGTSFFFEEGPVFTVGSPPSLHLQNLTIETWVKRQDASIATRYGGYLYGTMLSWTDGGWEIDMTDGGSFGIKKAGVLDVWAEGVLTSTLAVTDTNYHHIAITKNGTNVVFYLDGASEVAKPYDPGFTFDSALSIGGWNGGITHSFYGYLDELSIYDHALSAQEINSIYSAGFAGKCAMPPVFLQPLTDMAVVVGSNAVFNLQINGTQPMSRQWFFNDMPLADGANVSGSTSLPLTLINAQTNQSGIYYMVVSNILNVTTSTISHVSVGFLPSIQQDPVSESALDGSNVIFSVLSGGDIPLAYHWRFNGNNLSPSSRMDGVESSTLSISNLTIADIGNYDVVVTNIYGSATSSVAALFVVTTPPVVIADPTNRVVLFGKATTIAATVSGLPDLFYRWQKDGADIFDTGRVSGTETPALTISNIQVSDIGAYRLMATNAHGVAITAEANLAVVPIAVWGETDYGQADVPLSLTNAIAVAAQGYTIEHMNVGLRSDRTLSVWGYYYDGNFRVYFDPTNIPAGTTNVLQVSAGYRHGLALKSDFSVVGFGDNSFGQTNIPSGLGPIVVAGAGGLHNLLLKSSATLNGWGYEVTPPSGISNVIAICAGYWHSLAIKTDGSVIGWGLNDYGETNTPSGLSNVVAVSAGSHHSLALKSDGTVVGWGYNANGQAQPPADLSNVVAIAAGYSYSLALKSDGTVVGWGGDGGSPTVPPPGLTNVVGIAAGYVHSVAVIQSPLAQAAPVTWWQGPTNRIVLAGQNVAFIPAFSGSQPISFQWYYNDAPLPDQTNGWLVMDSLLPAQSGDYKLTLTNSVGSVTSAVTKVQVGYAPAWTLQPTSQTNIAGNTAQFNADSTGSDPRFYQWFFNSTPLSNDARRSGATNATLVISNLLTTDAGNYSVRVTNLFGSLTSTNASLTILVLPKITTQPVGRTVVGRSFVNFSVAATGTFPLHYFWQKNGQPIPGATSTFLQLFDVRRTNEGVYSVLVTNSAGSVTSSNATLRVLMAQKFQTPTRLQDGSISFLSSDFDGGLIPESDLVGFDAIASTNLANWDSLTNALSLTNGMLLLSDPLQSNNPIRFYRIMEH